MFSGDLRVEYDDKRRCWVLVEPLIYRSKQLMWVRVPPGYPTDLDSVPRVPFVYAWLKGRAVRSAVVHDWLCYCGHDRAIADRVFLDAMKKEGVHAVNRRIIFAAVRLYAYVQSTKHKVFG